MSVRTRSKASSTLSANWNRAYSYWVSKRCEAGFLLIVLAPTSC